MKVVLRNYIKTAFRNIYKQKLNSLINIFGLAIGFTAFLLILLYVQFELSYDKYHENAESIYRIVNKDNAKTPPALGPTLMRQFPEVISAARIVRDENSLFSYKDKSFLEKAYYWADPEIIEVFSIQIINCNSNNVLKDPNTVLLSEKYAKKYFGREDPIGKVITLGNEHDYEVSGVFTDMPENSHLKLNIILPCESFFKVTGNPQTAWSANFLYTYFLLQKDADVKLLAGKFNPLFRESYLDNSKFDNYKPYMAQPIKEIHLYSHRRQEIEGNNDIKNIILFSIVALLILIIACINYLNMSAAQIMQRFNEINIRKAIGANRRHLLVQFLGESLTIIFVALIITTLLLEILLPSFENLIGKEINVNLANNFEFYLGVTLIILSISLIASMLPLLFIIKIKFRKDYKNIFKYTSKQVVLKNLLVFIQFSITVFLIISTLTINKQLALIMNFDVGYDKEQIINIRVIDEGIRKNIKTIKAELLKDPKILAVSTSEALPNNIIYHNTPRWLNKNREEPISICYNTVSYDFVDVFGIEIVDGRNFSTNFSSDQNGVFLLNETAAKLTDWDSVVGKNIRYYSGESGPIVGIMKDFNLQSIHNPIVPLYFLLDEVRYNYISIRLDLEDVKKTINYIESVFKAHSPRTPFNYSFFNDDFEKAYFLEIRLVKIFNIFTCIAIIIACLGLLSLASYSSIKREKEIGIRKALGASILSVTLLLSKEFLRWVVLANFIAWPIAYLIMNKWLQNFAYKTSISWWIFFMSGALALFIALFTISFQTIKAASRNPIDILRYE